MSATSPTQRTLEECRRLNWLCQVTEYWQSSFAQTDIVKAATAVEAGQERRMLTDALAKAKKVGPGRRIDLFGFIDILAITPEGETIGIQTTSASGASARRMKILTECCDAARAWLKAGNKIEVWSWRKHKERGENGKWWQVKRVEITLDEVAF